MSEIYWITRLDAVIIAFGIILGISIVWLIIAFFCKSSSEFDQNTPFYKMIYKWTPVWIIVAIISTGIVTFVPSKNDALLIYGVGGTIDYIQNNKTAVGIPDKLIDCIDQWVDTFKDDQESSRENSRRR